MKKRYDPKPPIDNARIGLIAESLEVCNASLAPYFYRIFKTHLKKKCDPRIIQYRSITETHYKKLLTEIENDYCQRITFNDFSGNEQYEELAAYFTKYLQLIIMSSVPHIDAVIDFYRVKKRSLQSDPDYHYHSNALFSTRDRILKIKNDVLNTIKNDPKVKDLKNKKLTDKTLEKDYGAMPPESFFSEKDGEKFEVLLEKLVHTDCFLYGHKKVGVRYKKGSRGTNTEILKSSKKYYYALYIFFKALNFTNVDSARHTETCLQNIYARIIKQYSKLNIGTTFVYKASTMLQNIKEDEDFNIDFKNSPLELLIPKI